MLGFLACACVVRRDAFLAAGGFHPLLFFGGKETLLAYDMAAAGWGMTYVPSLTARHVPEPGGRDGRSHLVRRNEVLTLWLRRPLPVAMSASARLATSAVTGEPGARRALREVLVRWPAAVRRRRRLPPNVEQAARLLDGDGALAPAGDGNRPA